MMARFKNSKGFDITRHVGRGYDARFIFNMIHEKRDDAREAERAKVFMKLKTYVHVGTGTNFYNGYIREVHDTYFLFRDDELPQDVPIFFSDMNKPIEPSIKRKGMLQF